MRLVDAAHDHAIAGTHGPAFAPVSLHAGTPLGMAVRPWSAITERIPHRIATLASSVLTSRRHPGAMPISGPVRTAGHVVGEPSYDGGHRTPPEMRYVAIGAPARATAGTRRADAQFVADTGRPSPAAMLDDEESRARQPVFRALTGRAHRPSNPGAADAATGPDDPHHARAEMPDLDRLASSVYGRIKRQLAVERERRGFVS